MPQFRSLKELQDYLEHFVADVMEKTADVERALVDAMVEEVIRVVYNAYQPTEYQRRGENDGLADPRNMMITGVSFLTGGKVHVTFENLAEANDLGRDGEMLTDIIVEGNPEDWANPDGPWSAPRDFIASTAENLRNNPTELVAALKKGLAAKGFTVN